MSEKTIGVGNIIKGFNEKLQKEREEVKRLREVIDGEHPTFDWASRQTIANLEAEVKRLREAFITAVRHVGEHDLSRDDLFSKLDEDLFSLWLFRSE